jgi:hypothetical protein
MTPTSVRFEQAHDVPGVDGGHELAGLLFVQDRCLALLDHEPGTAHGRGRVEGNDLTGDQVVEEHPDGQVRLAVAGGRSRVRRST